MSLTMVLILAINRDSLWTVSGYIITKRATHQEYLFDKMPIVQRGSCLSYISVQMVYCYRRNFENHDKEAACQFYTNKYRSLLAAL